MEIKLHEAFRGAACVVHLAWGFQPTRNTRYLDAVALNGSGAVLGAAHEAKVPHLIHMSSVSAYAPGRYGEKVDESYSTAGVPSPRWTSVEALGELIDGFLQHSGTQSPVLRPRSFVEAVTRDAAAGPLTTCPVP